MIYITGDCHGDFWKLSPNVFYEQKEMTKDDYLIICGDFGGIWYPEGSDNALLYEKKLDWLNSLPFTTLFVDGNHENFDRLNNYPVREWHGGKIREIRSSIFHLMRGELFDICGKKIFTFGGASSHDIDDGILDRDNFKTDEDFMNTVITWNKQGKMYRINHLSWWKEEMPSREEMDHGLEVLAAAGNEVDYIVSHCGPQDVASIFSHGLFKADELTMYFSKISSEVKFDKWFFGHYHSDQAIMSKFIMLYDQIVRIA